MPTFNLSFDDLLEFDDPELDEILAQSRADLEAEEAAPYRGPIQQQERHQIGERSVERDNGADAMGHGYYNGSSFPWSKDLKSKMRSIFRIQDFRHCQHSVCNASMDAKDIICVMPTGGGKSLTYQLPALLTRGCTLVVSPLVSLISDQLMYLQDAGVNAVKSIALTPDDDHEQTNQRLIAMAEGKLGQGEEDIRLCYVTKVVKSARFRSILERLVQDNKLTRIVIDEAHCIAEYGMEFRSDYKHLGILRQLFPSVPILALTATCTPRVLRELTSVLGLAQDAETVAKRVFETSGGVITTGVYHANTSITEKEYLHLRWKRGEIKVVCAAFGLGIDKGDSGMLTEDSFRNLWMDFIKDQGEQDAMKETQAVFCLTDLKMHGK
ncbi:uncharacterized protein ARMOST_20179 [Armillaria ostoyae]|uniref:DNA 3'-5' helicase n=1 Tax=Armillaria ostoyae TaxID=47428 RepID=A0A284S6L0_ARMOS|nr:uncharacterized protein ARMOST_20179 [Armillaria ostoyae]